MVLIE